MWEVSTSRYLVFTILRYTVFQRFAFCAFDFSAKALKTALVPISNILYLRESYLPAWISVSVVPWESAQHQSPPPPPLK